MLTVERLRELFHCEPETGVLTWQVNKGPFLAGDVVGRTVAKGKYPRVGIDGKRYIQSRVVWAMTTGEWPKHVIDHIDRNPLNTRFSNLRDVTQSKNCFNARMKTNNTTGYQGVFRVKHPPYKYNVRRKLPEYFAQIRINGKPTFLGYSDLYGCAGLYVVAKELFCLPKVNGDQIFEWRK